MSGEIKQNCDVKVINDNPTFPFVVIDNWYTPNEEKAIWKELDFISTVPKEEMSRAENGVVASSKGVPLSNAYRFYLEGFYKNKRLSPIFNCRYKQQTKQLHKIVRDNCMPYARSFLTSNFDSSMLSYYEEKDFYKPHHDTVLWTCLIWMVREPRLFDGGDFKMVEPDVEVKLKNNRMILFPSCFLHSVSPIKFHTQPKEIGYGRYCITHFYNTEPEDLPDEVK